MVASQEKSRKPKIVETKDLWEICGSSDLVRFAIPEGWEMLLPRVGVEARKPAYSSGIKNAGMFWYAETWWRSANSGVLGYYVKTDLETGEVKAFRELGDALYVSDSGDPAMEKEYLNRCLMLLSTAASEENGAEELDRLWRQAVPRDLWEAVAQARTDAQGKNTLLPLEALSLWRWEQIRDILLERYDTTREDVLDYLEYVASDSEERYIEPKYRDEARKRGIRFWRDGNDV